MSILAGKHVLVIGEETEQISKVEAALITYGAEITSTTCETAQADTIISQSAHLILLNHLHEGSPCRTLLQSLQQQRLHSTTPIFALVQDDQLHINEAFLLGAFDYITPAEDVHTVIDKIKSVLQEGSTGPDGTVIDITSQASTATSGTKVFVVEDDPLLRNLLAVKFEKSNLPFEIASDGEGVVEKVLRYKPDIVVLDLMLPGKDGFVVLEELKASGAANIPVLVFSNKDSQEDRARAKSLGAADFRVKAMTDLSELLVLIESTIQQ